MPFLTDLDSRAEVKGSRDPLGLMALWSHFGREVVGNLSTVTSSVRGFTTLLLGLYYGEQLQESVRDSKRSLLDTFLKFEQLAGYARVLVNKDSGVGGWSRRARAQRAAEHDALSQVRLPDCVRRRGGRSRVLNRRKKAVRQDANIFFVR